MSRSSLKKISSLVRLISESLDFPWLLTAIESAGEELLNCEKARVWLYDSASTEFYSPALPTTRLGSHALFGTVKLTKRPIYSYSPANFRIPLA